MFKLRHRLMLTVVVASGMSTILSVDRNYRPIARIDPSQEPTTFAGSPQESIVPAEPLVDVRKAERSRNAWSALCPRSADSLVDVRKAELSRRAVRPADDPEREDGLNYAGVLKGWEGRGLRPKPAEPMPSTYCRSIECAPKNTDWGPYYIHDRTVDFFESNSGFGLLRMFWTTNDRGVDVVSRDIDRVELVSLLTDDEPSVYVLDEMATPALARQAKRRPLDDFERLGLNAMRFGEDLVWTREAPTRMFGAIRAKADCLHCHANAKEGDLLGAFTYYLTVPVDRLNYRRNIRE
jgi:hypothetical protein